MVLSRFEGNRLFLPVVALILAGAALLIVFRDGPESGCRAVEVLRHADPASVATACDQNALGDLYYYGDGIPQDFGQAFHWFSLAAEQDYDDAQHNLGEMYFNGESVPKDYVQSYMWLTLAARDDWSLVGKAATEFRKKLGTLMSPEELEEAERLAEAWRTAHRPE